MMKLKLLGMLAGTALLALPSQNASAHADVYLGLGLGVPAPLVVEVYAPVRYASSYRAHPRRPAAHRHAVRCHERHDRGRHRGHARHH